MLDDGGDRSRRDPVSPVLRGQPVPDDTHSLVSQPAWREPDRSRQQTGYLDDVIFDRAFGRGPSHPSGSVFFGVGVGEAGEHAGNQDVVRGALQSVFIAGPIWTQNEVLFLDPDVHCVFLVR